MQRAFCLLSALALLCPALTLAAEPLAGRRARLFGGDSAVKRPALRARGLRHVQPAPRPVDAGCAAQTVAAEQAFRSLFNGRDLSGWEGAGDDAAKCWQVRDGLLVCTGKPGPWLRSVEQFGDFNLRLEYKVKPGGNSGVYVRVPADGKHHGAGAGIEVQILDDAAERYKTLKPYQFAASLYAIVAAEPRVGRPAGEWNTLEINCHGHAYRIVHNGVTVIKTDTAATPQLQERNLNGFLGLQNHSEEVQFRHLRIGPPQP